MSVPRNQSGYWHDSTLIMSAPRSPIWRVAVGPAQPMVRSMMRRPFSGSTSFGVAARVALRVCGCRAVLSSAPGSGARPLGFGRERVRYCGSTGPSNEAVPISTVPNAPRSRCTSWSSSSFMSGTTASGRRSSMPISNHSSAVFFNRAGVMIAFNSSACMKRPMVAEYFGSAPSSGMSSILQNATHCAGVTTVTPSQPCLVTKLPLG